MIFNSFGDSDSYEQIGKALALHLQDGNFLLTFSSNAMQIRPIGAAIYHALPFLISNDTVTINYILFWMNMLFYFIAIYSVIKILNYFIEDQGMNFGNSILISSTLIVSIFYFPQIVVRSMDIQGLALLLLSITILIKIIDNVNNHNFFLYGQLFIFLSLISIAGLMKQSYFLYGIFLGLTSIFYIKKSMLFSILQNKYFYIVVLIGLWGLWLQFFYVFYHFGDFWFIKKDALNAYSASHGYPNISLFAYTIPYNSAYVLKIDPESSKFVWVLSKLYFVFFKYNFHLYNGLQPHPDVIFYMTNISVSLVIVALLVIFFLLTLTYMKSKKTMFKILIVYTLIYLSFPLLIDGQAELKRYDIFKIILIIIFLVYLYQVLSNKFGRTSFVFLSSFIIVFTTFLASSYLIYNFVQNQNNKIVQEKTFFLLTEQLEYLKKQIQYIQFHKLEATVDSFSKYVTITQNEDLTKCELNCLWKKKIEYRNAIDYMQKIIDQFEFQNRQGAHHVES